LQRFQCEREKKEKDLTAGPGHTSAKMKNGAEERGGSAIRDITGKRFVRWREKKAGASGVRVRNNLKPV